MKEPSRQIHLDFHTSEHLPKIGSEFDKKQFQDALKKGRVNLINIFAKGHHSWSYYPTEIGMPHPNLECADLLGAQIEACHEIGVKAPVYFTVGWSANDAENHPEWCMRQEDGRFVATDKGWPEDVRPEDPKPTFQWKDLCINTAGDYHKLIMAQTEEICRRYPVDGMWYDIYHPHQNCYCETCRKGMADEGVDISDPEAVEAYRGRAILEHAAELEELVLGIHPDASLYFNGLTTLDRPQNYRYRLYSHNTKNDLEDLPTTWGGYDKFPLRAKVFHREGKPIVAMSGKFHTAWGEFGGFKDPEAIRFEAAGMIAYGANCNFGDQLHPSGLMDETTYANIGHAYEYVEKIEEYGIGGLPEASLGVWPVHDLEADEGLCRMLLEEQLDFDVVGKGDSLEAYETIIIPSLAGALEGAEEQLKSFVENGGKVLVLGQGALNAEATATILDWGAEYTGPANYEMDFTRMNVLSGDEAGRTTYLRPESRKVNLPSTPFLNFRSAWRFSLGEDSRSLASVYEPYFNRTYAKYCGHQNSPNRSVPAEHPASWISGNVAVIAHDIDRMYYVNGAKVHRDYFVSILGLLHSRPMAEAALPSAGRISLLHQKNRKRYVAHLLYGPPIKRGNCSVIEDLPVLRDVKVRLRLPVEVKSLKLIPGEINLDFEKKTSDSDSADIYTVVIPSFSCHCGIVAEY